MNKSDKTQKKQKVGVLFSGGKDSCLALHKYGKQKIDVLLNLNPQNKDSYMFHKPDLKLLKKQGKMLNLKLIIQKTKGEKETELKDLRKLLKKSKINKLIIGGIKSNYQGQRISKICQDLNVKVKAPLWNYTAEKLWQELLENKFQIILTKISCEGIPSNFIGKIINKQEYEKLKKLSEKYKFSLDFEGGEAESAVLFMPEFKKQIKLDYNIKSDGKYRHFLKLKKIR